MVETISVATDSLFFRHPDSLRGGGSEPDPGPISWSYLTLRSVSTEPRSHTPHLQSERVGKELYLPNHFSFISFILSSLSGPVSVSLTPFLFCGGGERWRCSREMMKFQGKVEVPSITGGGKVQINHLISPAFSPLSWGSRAKGKSITLYKWDMTGRSLRLCSGLWAHLSLALLLDLHTSSQHVNKDEGPEQHRHLSVRRAEWVMMNCGKYLRILTEVLLRISPPSAELVFICCPHLYRVITKV